MKSGLPWVEANSTVAKFDAIWMRHHGVTESQLCCYCQQYYAHSVCMPSFLGLHDTLPYALICSLYFNKKILNPIYSKKEREHVQYSRINSFKCKGNKSSDTWVYGKYGRGIATIEITEAAALVKIGVQVEQAELWHPQLWPNITIISITYFKHKNSLVSHLESGIGMRLLCSKNWALSFWPVLKNYI